MDGSWRDILRALGLAVLVHLGFLALLVLGTLDWPSSRPEPVITARLVDATPILEQRRAEERAEEMPMVQELLRTTVRAQVLAYRDREGQLRQTLPPHPPDIHDFVEPCPDDAVRALEPLELDAAVDQAARVCDEVILEEYAQGKDLRVVLIDYEVVAAAIRTSTLTSAFPPRRVKVPSWSTWRSFACAAGLISPISSRKRLPPSACSKRPSRRAAAPVKAPFS